MESDHILKALVARMSQVRELREVVEDKELGIINPDVLREIALDHEDAQDRSEMTGRIELR